MRYLPLLFAALLLLAHPSAARPDVAPCHNNKPGEAAPSCTTLVVPQSLCRACPLRPALPDGNYASCTDIYDLTAPACRPAIRAYAAANPCDTRRAFQVDRWSAADRTSLDYFIYAMCEMCCDAAQFGSRVEQYEERRDSGRLWSAKRGNAAAHFFYDICTLYPSFQAFDLGEGECVDAPEGRSVCEDMREWVSGPGKNWFGDNDVQIGPNIVDAIEDSMIAMSCSDQTIWSNCVTMEQLQNRV